MGRDEESIQAASSETGKVDGFRGAWVAFGTANCPLGRHNGRCGPPGNGIRGNLVLRSNAHFHEGSADPTCPCESFRGEVVRDGGLGETVAFNEAQGRDRDTARIRPAAARARRGVSERNPNLNCA